MQRRMFSKAVEGRHEANELDLLPVELEESLRKAHVGLDQIQRSDLIEEGNVISGTPEGSATEGESSAAHVGFSSAFRLALLEGAGAA